MTVSELRKAYSQKRAILLKLMKKQKKLQKQLSGVDKQISSLRGDAVVEKSSEKVRVRQPRNAKPLRQFITDELKKAKNGMTLTDLTDTIRKQGFRSRSTKFSLVVYQGIYQLMLRKTVKYDKQFSAYVLADSGH